MKKIVSVIIALALAVTAVSISVSAAAAPTVDKSHANARINELVQKLNGKCFTYNGKPCNHNFYGSCDNCYNEKVITAKWFKDMFGTVNMNNIPGTGSVYPRAWTCAGFANFAFWYIFKTDNTDTVTKKNIYADVPFTKENLQKYAQPGDAIRVYKDFNNQHYFIFVSCDDSGVTLLDNNDIALCTVGYHKQPYSHYTNRGYTKMIISRANNYLTTEASSSTISDGTYFIESALKAGKVLDIVAKKTNSGANVHLWDYHGGTSQQFKITKTGDYYTIVNVNSGMALDVANGSAEKNANVQQYTPNGTVAQQWRIVDAGNGYYYIKSALGTSLDLAGQHTENGTNVHMYTHHGDTSQKYKLISTVSENTSSSSNNNTTSSSNSLSDKIIAVAGAAGQTAAEAAKLASSLSETQWSDWTTLDARSIEGLDIQTKTQYGYYHYVLTWPDPNGIVGAYPINAATMGAQSGIDTPSIEAYHEHWSDEKLSPITTSMAMYKVNGKTVKYTKYPNNHCTLSGASRIASINNLYDLDKTRTVYRYKKKVTTTTPVVTPSQPGKSVKVTLPTFKVTLGGMRMDTAYAKYPVIVYNDITYFPMTYHDMRLLGVATDYSTEEGLKVFPSNETVTYKKDTVSSRNSTSQTATIATGKITVNGRVINNYAEQYPFLLFRDVTYFPLTWAYAVDEFGWDYHFDNITGLVINK